jgi:hypothetical protein
VDLAVFREQLSCSKRTWRSFASSCAARTSVDFVRSVRLSCCRMSFRSGRRGTKEERSAARKRASDGFDFERETGFETVDKLTIEHQNGSIGVLTPGVNPSQSDAKCPIVRSPGTAGDSKVSALVNALSRAVDAGAWEAVAELARAIQTLK